MIFPYIKVSNFVSHKLRERYLPWVRFGIYNPINKSKIVYPLGLVDSGSEITFINHELGEQLGFNIKKGSKLNVKGVGGGSIEAYLFLVGLTIDDEKTNAKPLNIVGQIAFTYSDFPPTMPQQTAILGTAGFFKYFKVTFEFPRYIEINLISPAN